MNSIKNPVFTSSEAAGTPSVTKVYRHILAIDSSVFRKCCETFLGTEEVLNSKRR
jgi:hypothetical protein